ncbi:1,4-alpha-glucan branching protein GlgB [Paenibacillus sp. N3/727]|uniref:1,4-alpha-glucan branching protein GlgB n=1 Tax=Paenibacillus sp. N3/727 TaxID=2925845 RepID=UPI001F52C183|nr:1,4-alpha-glucan branching protein GlgB [Paenibacillus sp. N3/727]UNK20884.1 1,4-alpha-glucan branching protein GlgB [Paenibacillus sp. N3/727]
MTGQQFWEGNISPENLYLFHEGNLYHSYRFMGAHPAKEDGEEGVRFTVWAPNARHVGLAGDWNGWDGSKDSLFKIPESGVWSRFFPGITAGTFYKYHITGPYGETFLKADPYAFHAEVRPATASVVTDLSGYRWNDGAWKRKSKAPYQKPINIYEMHFGTWRQKEDGTFYKYREMADILIPYLLKMSYTHVEFMPLAEHPYDLSWGYQGTGFFALTSRYGSPHDFMYLVDRLHQSGIGVLLDWVPAHFAKDAHGLRQFDGTPLYEYSDLQKAEKPGWGTLSFDYSKPEVTSFLISNAIFWMEMYHIDGLRVDAVTSMIRLDFEKKENQYSLNEQGGLENLEAISFLQDLNKTVFDYYPNALMMAEESSAWPGVTASVHTGGLGFNYKWNMGWMNDTLSYIKEDFEARPSKHNLLTFPICYAYSENFTLPLSHDEVVHGKKSLLSKMPGSYEQKFAGLRVLLGYLMTQPGKKLLFMGGEFGQFIEWKDQEQLDWLLLDYEAHHKILAYTAALNRMYAEQKALWEIDHSMEGFQWICAHDESQSVASYMRIGKKPGDTLIVVINFQLQHHERYRIGMPRPGQYEEIFNSDLMEFGGEGRANRDELKTVKKTWHDQLQSLEIIVPPLSMVVLKKKPLRLRKNIKSERLLSVDAGEMSVVDTTESITEQLAEMPTKRSKRGKSEE